MSSPSDNTAFLLRCAVQNYAWGKLGSDSAVATLTKSACPPFVIDETKQYAELWMGTHVNGPNYTAVDKQLLSDWLKSHPHALGNKVQERFPTPGQLPFLFKVLSVNKSLSIQAHPDKKHAEELHSKQPGVYKDPNHKPEMAIALTKFEALCGFRPKLEIVSFMKNIPEFGSLIGKEKVEQLEKAANQEAEISAMRDCFTALMTSDPEVIKVKLTDLVNRVEKSVSNGDDTSSSMGELLLRLNGQFPGDVGCFNIYFLNYLTLNPGDAMFLKANLPHAYLAGDCLECMACSDNVVRAGLTPKFKDVDTLCAMLNYTCRSAHENLYTPKKHPTDPQVTVFNPPVPDFAVNKIELDASVREYTLESMDSASLCLVIKGEATTSKLNLVPGSVLFVPANAATPIQLATSGGALLMFRAYCNFSQL